MKRLKIEGQTGFFNLGMATPGGVMVSMLD